MSDDLEDERLAESLRGAIALDGPIATMDRTALERLCAALPAYARELLARGPMLPGENQYDCRVCEVLNRAGFGLVMRNNAALLLFDFHQAEGREGEAAYRRCVAIYRAAGWTGEYDARDLHGWEGDDG